MRADVFTHRVRVGRFYWSGADLEEGSRRKQDQSSCFSIEASSGASKQLGVNRGTTIVGRIRHFVEFTDGQGTSYCYSRVRFFRPRATNVRSKYETVSTGDVFNDVFLPAAVLADATRVALVPYGGLVAVCLVVPVI